MPKLVVTYGTISPYHDVGATIIGVTISMANIVVEVEVPTIRPQPYMHIGFIPICCMWTKEWKNKSNKVS